MALAGVPRALASSARLLSQEGFARLRTSTVAVVGVGGVGAWAAEALARSGVQGLVLIDMDLGIGGFNPSTITPAHLAWKLVNDFTYLPAVRIK